MLVFDVRLSLLLQEAWDVASLTSNSTHAHKARDRESQYFRPPPYRSGSVDLSEAGTLETNEDLEYFSFSESEVRVWLPPTFMC